MAKKCMSCGGAMKKMQKGGSNVKMGIYGIPQENIGTSSQFQPTAKKGGAVKKMAKGGSAKSFPDLNKDGKITKADILKGRGVIKKKGGPVKKK
jgi:hypothetical protein